MRKGQAMPRKKEPPKPMFDLRHDFVASLENVCQKALMLLQSVETVIEHGNLTPGIKGILVERCQEMRDALISKENKNVA
jgi:hypothetical protein